MNVSVPSRDDEVRLSLVCDQGRPQRRLRIRISDGVFYRLDAAVGDLVVVEEELDGRSLRLRRSREGSMIRMPQDQEASGYVIVDVPLRKLGIAHKIFGRDAMTRSDNPPKYPGFAVTSEFELIILNVMEYDDRGRPLCPDPS